MFRTIRLAFATIACLGLLAACVYEPVPAYYAVQQPAPSPAQQFDRAWNAALDAVRENGVQVTNSDPGKGVIHGLKDQSVVLVTVARQADGGMQVEVEAKGPQGRDAGLASRISQSFQRRMGR